MNQKSIVMLALLFKLLSTGKANAMGVQEQELIPEKSNPKKIETIVVESERPGSEGVPYSYDVCDDLSATRTDSKETHFYPRWFWDVDNDGKFGMAEAEFIKADGLVYMSDSFNNEIKNAFVEWLKTSKQDSLPPQNMTRDKKPESQEGNTTYHYSKKEIEEIERKHHTNAIKKANKRLKDPHAGCIELLKAGYISGREINYSDILDILHKNKMKKINYTDILLMTMNADEKERFYHNRAIKRANQGYQPSLKLRLEQDGRIDLVLAANIDPDFDNFGGSVGVQYTPFKNLSFSALASFNKAVDKRVSSTQTPEFKGITGEINQDENGSFSIGPSIEAQLGPLFIGGGFNYWNWIQQTEEKISRNDITLKSNINSIPNSQIFGNFYAGLEFKAKDFGLGGHFGYDGKQGMYFGARGTIRLNKLQNRPRGN